MAEKNPYDHKTQPAEWQQWINEQIAEHDQQVAESENENQKFEINPDDK